ncbi:hypothetical protein PG985_009799 [Apiospora marii]|uniref:uncharacterized protein n=1 Tax=Apiospora marii TaxID=335849 RepID=UPI003130A7A5
MRSPLAGVALALAQALVLFPGAARGSVTMNLFSDNACQGPVPGSVAARITDNRDSSAGTLTFYTHNDCAADQSSHGYSSANYTCLNNFGFVANAVGLVG